MPAQCALRLYHPLRQLGDAPDGSEAGQWVCLLWGYEGPLLVSEGAKVSPMIVALLYYPLIEKNS